MTPEEQNLLDEVEQGVNSTVAYPNQFAACDIYEAFLLMLVIQASIDEGASVEFRDGNDATTQSLTLRSGPSAIYTNSQYTHARITFPGKPPLEVHVGIYVAGLSSVVHECDVAVIDATEGRNCRANRSHPDRNNLMIGVECKYYSNNLGIDLIRSFLGLTDELKRKNRFFISNTGGINPQRILVRHDISWSTDLVPGNTHEITKIRSAFATIFQNYKVV